jgi:hypothetical protein
MQCSNMFHKCEEKQNKAYGNFPETFRKFSENLHLLFSLYLKTGLDFRGTSCSQGMHDKEPEWCINKILIVLCKKH